MSVHVSNRVLQQAERLYRAGQRQEAIDLLEWHMEGASASRKVASVLGKLYSSINHSRKAAYWLHRALEMDRQVVSETDVTGVEQPGQIGSDELDYIDSNSGSYPELKFDHYYGFDDRNLSKGSPNFPPELDDLDQGKEYSGPVRNRSLTNGTQNHGDLEEHRFDQEHQEFVETDCYGADSDEDESLIDEDDIDAFGSEATAPEIESDYDWEDYALDEDPLEIPDQAPIEELPLRVSDLRKARQVADKLASDADWEMDSLPILIEVLFHHRCHGKTRAALRSLLLEMEVTPNELSVMHELRRSWGGSGYNRTFRGNEAYEGWPTLSWQLSLRLLRQLRMDSEDEIFMFVEDCFQNWNDSPGMLSAYPIFSYYLNHVVDHMAKVSETCGQPMPPFIDYDLFPDDESYYESWRLNQAEFRFGYSIFSTG